MCGPCEAAKSREAPADKKCRPRVHHNSLDPTRVRIDNNVYDYLKSFCYEIEERPQLFDTIQILCSGSFDTEKAKLALVDAVDREQKKLDQKIRKNRKRMRDAYLTGVILSILGLYSLNCWMQCSLKRSRFWAQ